MSAFVCSVDSCTHTDRGNARFCRMHYMRWWKHGDPSVVLKANWTEVPTYNAVHLRLRAARGSAAEHACVDCSGQAAHWSYSHSSANELVDDRGRPYSADPQDYRPMCVSCHKRSDLARLQAGAH